MRFVFLISIALLLLAAAVVGKRRICQPGSVIRVDCNTCKCNSHGTDMACTKKYCGDHAEIRHHESETRVCKPGSSFKKDCNYCICSEDGTYSACTLKTCLP